MAVGKENYKLLSCAETKIGISLLHISTTLTILRVQLLSNLRLLQTEGTDYSQSKQKTVFLLFYPKCTKMFVRVEFFICQLLPSFRTPRTLFCKRMGVGVF
jgi:hypothetical protein